MEAGISSFAFGWAVRLRKPPLDELGLIGFARRHQVRVVQLGDNLPVHRMPEERRAALRQAATTAGIRLELGARGLTEAHLQTYLALCRELDSSLLRFVVDAPGHEPALADLAALLRNTLSALEAAQVTLAVENHDRFPAATLRRLMEDVGGPRVGICLDTANSFGVGEGLDQVVEALAPVTVNLHVKDVTIRRFPHQMGFVIEGCPLGRGQLPIRSLIGRLRGLGYRGSAILESWWPPGSDDPATIAGELAAAEAGIETLKNWIEP
ncbi:MAG: sugar phosphate isomerase/epimerase [Verrucomicrobiae bacterium]|nr:sugar phosphate isomerase/epimerase [Verrucomicrobiae bacterium]